MMRVAAVMVVGTALMGACSTEQRARTETVLAKALVSDEEEARLGAQFKQQLEQQGIKYVTDPVVVAYVRRVADRVLVQARKDRPDVQWHVNVIDDPKQVNAFATPG